MKGQWIAIDWDHTIWLNEENRPADGARDAISDIHEAGHKVLVHSCNSPSWIRKMCDEHDLRVDDIWCGGKPVCAAYVDDRSVAYKGDWKASVAEALQLVSERPMK